MTSRAFIMSVFCVLLQVKLFAAIDTTQLLHFDLNSGFPSNNVYSLIQDRNGYLWFATDNGLVKYNGYSFDIFNRSKGLPSNDVYQLYEDKRGRIWVYTLSYEFGYILNDKYHKISLTGLDKTLHVRDMADNGAFLFFCFWEHSHYSMAIVQNDIITTLPLYYPIERERVKKGTRISFCMISPNCKMWIIGYDNGLYMVDLLHPGRGYKKVCTINEFNAKYRNDNSVSHADKNEDILYFNFKGSNVFVINTKNCSYKYVPFNISDGENIYAVLDDVWAGNDKCEHTVITNTSLYLFDKNFKLLAKEKLSDLVKTSAQISYIFQDGMKSLWYPTNGDGVWCRYKQHNIFHLIDSSSLLKGARFIGTSNTHTYWWNKKRSVLYDLLPGKAIKQISFPPNVGLRWVAPCTDSVAYLTLVNGIFKYSWRDEQIKSITNNVHNTFIHNYNVQKTLVINSDTLEKIFFGNHYKFLIYDSSSFFSLSAAGYSYFKKYKADSLVCKILAEERYNDIFVDSVYKYVIAYNQQKISIFDPASGKLITFDNAQLARSGINNIVNVEIDRYRDIYIESDGQLILFNPLLNTGKIISCPFSLLDAVFHIAGNQLIIAGKFGIASAPINGQLSIGDFKVAPNINLDHYNRILDFVISCDSEMLLNTDKGFYKIGLGELRQYDEVVSTASPMFLQAILKTPFEHKLKDNDTIIIDQKLEKISLDAINYYGSGTPVYKYYIQGVTKDVLQSDGDIYVSGLIPGRYYAVNCSISDDLWNSRNAVFYLYRTPRWWQTVKGQVILSIAGLILLAALVFTIIFITRMVVAKGNEKKRALTELELKAIYSQINPHFIFNTLNAAQFFINKKRFDDAYTHVSKFSQLLRAYLKSSQDRYITLEDEIQMLKNYIELQQIRFEEKFDYKLEVENKIPVNSIKIPSLLLQPLVENAINHGLFHKESGGMLILKFLQGANNTELLCIIEDNGVGRDRSAEIKKQDSTRKESYGTRLTQQLIDIYREYEKMDIYLEYTDKAAPETGTIVTLTIKNVKYVA